MRVILTTINSVAHENYTLRMQQTDGAFPIYLYKKPNKDRYAVQYGTQLDYGLSYEEAAHKLGEASMHLLTCDGRLDP